MSYWLLKTEPSSFSYDDLEARAQAVWDGVSNNQALLHLRAMRKGDQALIYHTGGEKALVGTAEIVSLPYPDPKRNDPRLVVVDIRSTGRLARRVTLQEIKADKSFASFALLKNSRLSVMSVPQALWKKLLAMAD